MELKSKLTVCFAAFWLCLGVIACEKEGSAEKAGKEIDKAFSTVKEKVHEATK